MEIYQFIDVGFQYPNTNVQCLENLTFSIHKGEFVVVAGSSGCGKTTMLRQMKPELAPHGLRSGSILYEGVEITSLSPSISATNIGYVMQHPQHQIVSNKVWHELAFGLENLQISQTEMHHRIGEMAAFFGLEEIYHHDTSTLSGGQMQLVNLASIMVMHPEVLLLDEPCAQLDPIAQTQFLQTLKQINDNFGTTIVLIEHHLEEAMKLADRVLLMEQGCILCDGSPKQILDELITMKKPIEIMHAFPIGMRLYHRYQIGICPITIRDAKTYLAQHFENDTLTIPRKQAPLSVCLDIKDVYVRYEKQGIDILKGFNLQVMKGEVLAIVGGNGAGKTTVVKVMANLIKAYRGSIKWKGTKPSLGYLPQDPLVLFTKDTIREDIAAYCKNIKSSLYDVEAYAQELFTTLQMENILDQHPYDLSGGELQKAAICKVLLKKPDVLLLDEPTKGLDVFQTLHIRKLFMYMKEMNRTIILISHDLDFCAEVADRCAMVFDGQIISIAETKSFLSGNHFYTTSCRKVCHGHFENVHTWKELVHVCDLQQ